MAYGFNGFIGIGRETTWGSGVAVTNYFEALSENITVGIDRFDIKNIVGSLAEPDDCDGIRRVAGTISLPGHPETIGFFLNSMLYAGVTSTIEVGELFNHQFKTSTTDFHEDSPVQPYTFEINRDVTSSIRYTGCVVSQLELSVTPNQELRVNATIIGRGSEQISATTPTFPTSSAKPFTFDTASIQIGGSATTKIEALTVTLANALDGIPVLNNSFDIGKVRRNGFQTVMLSATLDFTSLIEYNEFINQSETDFKMSMTLPSSFQLTIDIPKLKYISFPLGIPGRERLTVDLEAKGYYNVSSATAIEINLTNNITAL